MAGKKKGFEFDDEDDVPSTTAFRRPNYEEIRDKIMTAMANSEAPSADVGIVFADDEKEVKPKGTFQPSFDFLSLALFTATRFYVTESRCNKSYYEGKKVVPGTDARGIQQFVAQLVSNDARNPILKKQFEYFGFTEDQVKRWKENLQDCKPDNELTYVHATAIAEIIESWGSRLTDPKSTTKDEKDARNWSRDAYRVGNIGSSRHR